MRVTVKGKNMEVTDALQRYAEKKIEKLGKYFSEIKEAIVTQSVQRNWHIVEVMLEGDGIVLRGEERSDNMYASIDQVVEKLEKQIKRFKGKLYDRVHEEPPKEIIKPVAEEEEEEEILEEEEEEAPEIVRTKKFALKPMLPEEAALQMELLNHDFFVFLNADTNAINVLYKRKDGHYGLIEPEV
ncbi:MAG: ribosome-associated translation inhibitor RaiA [Armatimonadota bacterium]|nr:ribosome-associated translation inhibitor RaiA [Armatimonadota bacterium]